MTAGYYRSLSHTHNRGIIWSARKRIYEHRLETTTNLDTARSIGTYILI